MIERVVKSVWETYALGIVIPVNTRGVMGAGLAKQAATKYPACLPIYRAMCRHKLSKPGRAEVISPFSEGPPLLIGLTTKDDWRYPSRIEWVDQCMVSLLELCARDPFDSIAVPALGAGLGQLSKDDVWETIMVRCNERPDIRWMLCDLG